VRIGRSHPVLPFLVKAAADLLNRAQRGLDGRTAYELRRGKPYRKALPPPGEKVLYLPAGKRVSRLEDRWKPGIYLGIIDNSDELIVGTKEGVFRARSVKRLTLDERKDPEFLNAIVGTPWKPVPTDAAAADGEIPPAMGIRVVVDPIVGPADLPAPVGDGQGQPRRLYIRREVELARYGFTDGCAGCVAAAAQGPPAPHSEACRARIIDEMKKDETHGDAAGRVQEAEQRVAAPAPSAGMDVDPAASAAAAAAPAASAAAPAVAVPVLVPGAPASSSSGAAAPMDDRARPEKRSRGPDGSMDSLCREVDAELTALGHVDENVYEAYSPETFEEHKAILDMVPEVICDARTGYDFTRSRDYGDVQWRLKVQEPILFVAAPLQRRDHRESLKAAVEHGRKHLDAVFELCMQQVAAGRHFLLELPSVEHSVAPLKEKGLLEQPSVRVIRRDLAVGKRIWITSSKHVGEALEQELKTDVAWKPEDFRRERYAPAFTASLLRAVKQERQDQGTLESMEAGPTVEEPSVFTDPVNAPWVEAFYDQVSGVKLDRTLVLAARAEEMAYMKQLEVFKRTLISEAIATTGRRPIGVRWVDINKGDDSRPEYRSRLVTQETKRVSTIAVDDLAAVFAATPPLEALRALLSMAMSQSAKGAERPVLMFLDVSRAHLHSDLHRDVYVAAPPEDTEADADTCWKLLKAMYGLRDAGQAFDIKVEKVMDHLGFVQGVFSPCCYYHPKWALRVYRHGDDFVVLGSRRDLEVFFVEVNKHMIVKKRGVLGPDPSRGDVGEIICLNRIIRWVPDTSEQRERIEYEPDPRHFEILRQQVGLDGASNPVTTPGVKRKQGTPEAPVLTPAMHSIYRSACMRLAYLAMDRAELQYTSKELARRMSAPTEEDMQNLKRAVRFLLGAPRTVCRFERQGPVTEIRTYSDSDHAGCTRTRKSTSSTVVMLGHHYVKSTSTTQQLIALSTGESEFYALVKAASVAIGMRALMKDFGVELSSHIFADATAGIGMASRVGAGKVRHIHTPSLWIQRLVRDRLLHIHKVAGSENPADLGTKFMDAKTTWYLLGKMGHFKVGGRSKLALDLARR